MDKSCFELKGSLFTLTVLQLFQIDLSLLEEQLNERIKMAPGFFNHTPMVIDLHELSDISHQMDFVALKQLLLSLSIIPVGVKGAEKSIHATVEAAGLAILAEAKAHKPKEEPKPEPTSEPEPKEAEPEKAQTEVIEQETVKAENEPPKAIKNNTKIVRQTVRSGQQIYAPGGDLVIIGSVSTGAEILADGNIHIYGILRGRALAGVRGDTSRAIFCHSLQAELCSIAGIYILSDDVAADKIGQNVQIYLEDEKLQIEAI